jgi:hypothetical protein
MERVVQTVLNGKFNQLENFMKFTLSTACAIFFMANLAFAQSSQMSEPDILGIKLGMAKSAALAIIKDKYPESKTTIVKKEITIGTADLIYETQYNISLDKVKPSTSEDHLIISFLPDDTIIGIRRLIKYFPKKQTVADISTALEEKYGSPVYFVYDNSTKFEDRTMWSDRMPRGLRLVGTNYVQGGIISSSDFGTATPYPYCWGEMLDYAGDQYDPKSIYRNLTDRSGVALNRAKQWKSCGKALWVANNHETPLYFNATQTEIILVDLSMAPDLILNLPNMLKNNPKTTYAKPVTELPKASANTPNF